MLQAQGGHGRGRASGEGVVNNNININKISINNYYNRQDVPGELYSMRSRRTNRDQATNELRVKTDPSGASETHKKNFSLNEHNLAGDHFAQLKK